MSHMPVPQGLQPAQLLFVAVEYTATGSEGTDFMVPIGRTMANTTYIVQFTPESVAAVPALSIPKSGRTTTAFEVITNGPLTAGDVLCFLITQGAAVS